MGLGAGILGQSVLVSVAFLTAPGFTVTHSHVCAAQEEVPEMSGVMEKLFIAEGN